MKSTNFDVFTAKCTAINARKQNVVIFSTERNQQMRQRAFLVPFSQRNTLKWLKVLIYLFILHILFLIYSFLIWLCMQSSKKENVHCLFLCWLWFFYFMDITGNNICSKEGVLKMISFGCQMLLVHWRFSGGTSFSMILLGSSGECYYSRLSPL